MTGSELLELRGLLGGKRPMSRRQLCLMLTSRGADVTQLRVYRWESGRHARSGERVPGLEHEAIPDSVEVALRAALTAVGVRWPLAGRRPACQACGRR